MFFDCCINHKKSKNMRKLLIGYVGVDSGQILVCDPCYIDSEWKKENFADIRKYKHKETGDVVQYTKDFSRFDVVIPKYNKSMNDMIDAGEVEEMTDTNVPENNFSYNACCQLTLSPKRFGQLNYNMGHPGVGVVTSSGVGDGYYPVFAMVDRDGTVMSITVDFLGNEEHYEEEGDSEESLDVNYPKNSWGF